MTELRWALLLLGLLFVAGLITWELVKRRGGRSAAPVLGHDSAQQSGRSDEPSAHGSDAVAHRREALREASGADLVDSSDDAEVAPLGPPEPSLGDLPRIHDAEDNPVDRAMRWLEIDTGAAVHDSSGPEGVSRPPSFGDGGRSDRPALRLQWPDESERRIAALRVMPAPGERFPGAMLRQALSSEGFVHGELDIFHWPLPDGRIVLSAASLTKPGSFDPATMDAQQFAGLNLFAVLPGPLGGAEAVNQLWVSAGALAGRLRGQVRDQGGEAVTEPRLAAMRREFAAVLPVIRVDAAGEAPAQGPASQ